MDGQKMRRMRANFEEDALERKAHNLLSTEKCRYSGLTLYNRGNMITHLRSAGIVVEETQHLQLPRP